MRKPPRSPALLSVALALLLTMPALAQNAGAVKQHWIDFNHYVRVARPDLAKSSATALLEADDDALLDAVESEDYRDWEKITLPRALGMETLKDQAQRLAGRIQSARIARMQEPQRIGADIQKLSQGARPMQNAIDRLRSAGQHAAPQLLATLLDENQADLHPYVMSAMVSIGQPIVYPLSEALSKLEPVPMRQVARVLAEIGYPRPLPYLKEVLENPKLNPTVRPVLQAAYDALADRAGVSGSVTAAEMFFEQGQAFYDKGRHPDAVAGVPGYDAATNEGLVWEYLANVGLVKIPVPGAVFADVLAMRSARHALQLNPRMDPALSLWLAANLRRENRLAGAADPSYPAEAQEPAFYLRAAGPLRQHDVLALAMTDQDTELALDAITALEQTAGTSVLLNLQGSAQPLLSALSYPDRRIRWRAAQVLALARPTEPFPDSFRVVPVLAEAVRQSGQKRAVVIAPEQETVNRLVDALGSLGYRADGATSLDALLPVVNAGPGADLIVTRESAARVKDLYRQTRLMSKLAFVPVLALVSEADLVELNRQADRYRLLHGTAAPLSEISGAVEAIQQANTGSAIGEQEALDFSLTSLSMLRRIALGVSAQVYRIEDGKTAVIEAMSDSRPPVVLAAAGVLALLDDEQAQGAIAKVALDEAAPVDLRVALLGHLADSAKQFGDKLDPRQTAAVLELVKRGRGDLALAAARAHGALTLPTANVVEMIRQ